jgi:hypothetical protein
VKVGELGQVLGADGYLVPMDFEFQLQTAPDEWRSLGVVGTPGNRFDVEEAAVGLRDLHGGDLPKGPYRVRAVELEDQTWIDAEVDEHGVFRRLT